MYDGDTLFLDGNLFPITDLVIEKKISVIGLNNPVLDAENKGGIILVVKSGVKISGITFRNTGFSSMQDIAAIKIENSSDCIISNNIIENSFFAIYLSGCQNINVVNNRIIGRSVSESFSGNGIHLWNCDNIKIFGNEISGQRDGIYFEFAKNSIISCNKSYDNLRYGLHFMFSEGNKFVFNTFSSNGAGVAVMYTNRIMMLNNNFTGNWSDNSCGLLLKEINRSIIAGNDFHKNSTGIFSEGSNILLLRQNRFRSNGWAIKIMGNCYYDTLVNNSFTNNTYDISTNTSLNNNYFNRNYWDKYEGYDLNMDKIGDVPYRPVSLFSVFTERTPEASVLMETFFVKLFDLAERLFPVFTPESLKDDNPLMYPLL